MERDELNNVLAQIVKYCDLLRPLLERVDKEIALTSDRVYQEEREIDQKIWQLDDELYEAEARGDDARANELGNAIDELQDYLVDIQDWLEIVNSGDETGLSKLKGCVEHILEVGTDGLLEVPESPLKKK